MTQTAMFIKAFNVFLKDAKLEEKLRTLLAKEMKWAKNRMVAESGLYLEFDEESGEIGRLRRDALMKALAAFDEGWMETIKTWVDVFKVLESMETNRQLNNNCFNFAKGMRECARFEGNLRDFFIGQIKTAKWKMEAVSNSSRLLGSGRADYATPVESMLAMGWKEGFMAAIDVAEEALEIVAEMISVRVSAFRSTE